MNTAMRADHRGLRVNVRVHERAMARSAWLAALVTLVGCSTGEVDTIDQDSDALRDRTPPSVAIVAPQPDQTVSEVFTASGSASDNVVVARVEYAIDGAGWSIASGTTRWSFTVDTRSLADGTHSLAVRALDAKGNVGATRVGVLVRNAASCGDGACNGSETCASCAGDCGACAVACGDGSCAASETCTSCAADCGACAATCGDGACAGTETCATCPSDCACSAGVLVPAGATWKYLDDGSDQGSAWRTASFSDLGWKSGAAQLGYGEGDEATVLGYGPSSSAKFITTYFRIGFSVADATEYTGAALRLLVDDGAVVYLNGAEVARFNMPSGAVTSATEANGTPCETCWNQASIPAAALKTGRNVLAVEVHQSDPSSSDVSFDLELKGTAGSASLCGDGSCGGTETCSTCPGDCGACAAACGDRSCNGVETCSSCPGDCGACAPSCGDRVCNGTETCSSCASDCGACAPSCGDRVCNGIETCSSCASDCGACAPSCGDRVCNGTETCSSCATDCGACPATSVCGDHVCNGSETCSSCSTDCGACPAPTGKCIDPLTGKARLASEIVELTADVAGRVVKSSPENLCLYGNGHKVDQGHIEPADAYTWSRTQSGEFWQDMYHSDDNDVDLNVTFPIVQNIAMYNSGQGVIFREKTDYFLVKDVYIQHAGDDGIESDTLVGGIIDDVLIDKSFSPIAWRMSGGTCYNKPNNVVKVSNSIIRAFPQYGIYPGYTSKYIPGYGTVFKWEKVCQYATKLELRNTIIVANQNGMASDNLNLDANGNLTVSENNTLVWLGSTPYTGKIPAGFRVTNDINVFVKAWHEWFARHPQIKKPSAEPDLNYNLPPLQ